MTEGFSISGEWPCLCLVCLHKYDCFLFFCKASGDKFSEEDETPRMYVECRGFLGSRDVFPTRMPERKALQAGFFSKDTSLAIQFRVTRAHKDTGEKMLIFFWRNEKAHCLGRKCSLYSREKVSWTSNWVKNSVHSQIVWIVSDFERK